MSLDKYRYNVRTTEIDYYQDTVNNEIYGMFAFNDLNIVQGMPQSCFYEDKGTKFKIYYKLYQYDSDLDNKLKNRNFTPDDIWKVDIAFKILSSIKKLHD